MGATCAFSAAAFPGAAGLNTDVVTWLTVSVDVFTSSGLAACLLLTSEAVSTLLGTKLQALLPCPVSYLPSATAEQAEGAEVATLLS